MSSIRQDHVTPGHACNGITGNCPGPCPSDYYYIREAVGGITIQHQTYYVNHGDTWQSCADGPQIFLQWKGSAAYRWTTYDLR